MKEYLIFFDYIVDSYDDPRSQPKRKRITYQWEFTNSSNDQIWENEIYLLKCSIENCYGYYYVSITGISALPL